MGDTSNTGEETTAPATDDSVTSSSAVNALHSAKPSQNIAISDKTPSNSQEKIEKIIQDDTPSEQSVQRTPTALEAVHKSEEKIRHGSEAKRPEDERKPLIDGLAAKEPNRIASQSSPQTDKEKKSRVGSAASGLMHAERINRNQSDIFSLKEETSIASSIFSVNGSPSRKVFRRREAPINNVFPLGPKEEPPSEKASTPKGKVRDTKDSYNDLKRPSSSLRNPLTGTGLSSNDEYKFKGNRRKDGNPLLGLGYSPEATPSAHRIPPGGFSHKLW